MSFRIARAAIILSGIATLAFVSPALAKDTSEQALVPLPSVLDFTQGDGFGVALGVGVEYEGAYDGSDETELEVEPAGAVHYRKGDHLFFWEGMELGWRGRLADVWLVQAGIRNEDLVGGGRWSTSHRGVPVDSVAREGNSASVCGSSPREADSRGGRCSSREACRRPRVARGREREGRSEGTSSVDVLGLDTELVGRPRGDTRRDDGVVSISGCSCRQRPGGGVPTSACVPPGQVVCDGRATSGCDGGPGDLEGCCGRARASGSSGPSWWCGLGEGSRSFW